MEHESADILSILDPPRVESTKSKNEISFRLLAQTRNMQIIKKRVLISRTQGGRKALAFRSI